MVSEMQNTVEATVGSWWDENDQKHSLPLTAAVPFDFRVATWSRFGPTFEAYEYTGWIDESLSWKTDCYIGDWSPLPKVRVRGLEAKAFFEFISTNHWPNFKPGQAKHAIFCRDDGAIVGEGLVLMVDTNDLIFTSGPGTLWVIFQFHHGRRKFNITLDVVSDDWYLLQVQGPKSVGLLDELTDNGVRDIKFMNWKKLSIAGSELMCLRQGVSGEHGFELWGPMNDARKVYKAIVEYGSRYGIRQLGARAKMVNHVEAAFATPTVDFVPAVQGNDPEMRAFQQFAKDVGIDFDMMSHAAGSYGSAPDRYHFTPFELNWGWLVNFDHEFIGREALMKSKRGLPKNLVTLVWNKDDVTDVFASLFNESPYEYMEMPRSLLGKVIGSSVKVGSEEVGVALSRCYSYWFKQMLSLAIVEKGFSAPGTEVEVIWGNEGSPQKVIRAIVHPAPYKEDRRRYSIQKSAQ